MNDHMNRHSFRCYISDFKAVLTHAKKISKSLKRLIVLNFSWGNEGSNEKTLVLHKLSRQVGTHDLWFQTLHSFHWIKEADIRALSGSTLQIWMDRKWYFMTHVHVLFFALQFDIFIAPMIPEMLKYYILAVLKMFLISFMLS